MTETQNLFFPQWQGWGNNTMLYDSATALYHLLKAEFMFDEIAVSLEPSLIYRNIVGYTQILTQLQLAHRVITHAHKDRIFVLGGDCSVSMPPVTYLNKKYQGDFMVIWLDAHADLNTPLSSPSKTFHGMPLRHLVGEGDEVFCGLNLVPLEPDQILYIGLRDTDPDEKRFINEKQVSVVTSLEINAHRDHLETVLSAKPYQHVYIHIDIDILDPREYVFSAYPTDEGITVSELHRILNVIRQHKQVVGGAVVEFVGLKPNELTVPKELFELLVNG